PGTMRTHDAHIGQCVHSTELTTFSRGPRRLASGYVSRSSGQLDQDLNTTPQLVTMWVKPIPTSRSAGSCASSLVRHTRHFRADPGVPQYPGLLYAQLRILATSRSAVRVSGEHLRPVRPLRLPPPRRAAHPYAAHLPWNAARPRHVRKA